jgi:hypothetical protein
MPNRISFQFTIGANNDVEISIEVDDKNASSPICLNQDDQEIEERIPENKTEEGNEAKERNNPGSV